MNPRIKHFDEIYHPKSTIEGKLLEFKHLKVTFSINSRTKFHIQPAMEGSQKTQPKPYTRQQLFPEILMEQTHRESLIMEIDGKSKKMLPISMWLLTQAP